MALLSLKDVRVSFGGPWLLGGITFQIEPGQRIGLLGRNGSGKSTMMKVMAGELKPDSGEVEKRPLVKVARLSQGVPQDLHGSVFDVVAQGLDEVGGLIANYHHATLDVAAGNADALDRLGDIQQRLDANDGWALNQQVEATLSRLDLEPDVAFDTLSGGMKRRVLLARTLVTSPDLLLLDEPTNHLDIEAITWLESFLMRYEGTLFFVTHDRVFLRNLATRIVELDRGRLYDWQTDYDTFLERKQALIDAEATQQAQFDKKLAEEEAWIRKGIKARRTRNEGRVRALEAMREERQARRGQQGTAQIRVAAAERSGKRVVEAKNISYGYAENPIICDFSTFIARGDKVGIIGPNGSGKTTLLRLLLGSLEPSVGEVKTGANLHIAYFDQHRAQLDEMKSVQENVAPDGALLTIGSVQKHVMSYLQDFLFTPDRARSPVSVLSGGERNRLLLAKLFTQPSNVLVLDEPTNDLDTETLELLEELLLDYGGTILLVSHDRALLNNVVTSTLVLEPGGRVGEYVGGYDDWLRQRLRPKAIPKPPPATPEPGAKKPEQPKLRRLSYQEKKELAALPKRLEALEAEQQQIHELMADPDFYKQDSDTITKAMQKLEALERDIEAAFERWEELEAIEE